MKQLNKKVCTHIGKYTKECEGCDDKASCMCTKCDRLEETVGKGCFGRVSVPTCCYR